MERDENLAWGLLGLGASHAWCPCGTRGIGSVTKATLSVIVHLEGISVTSEFLLSGGTRMSPAVTACE